VQVQEVILVVVHPLVDSLASLLLVEDLVVACLVVAFAPSAEQPAQALEEVQG
jgi:hypothetical protein